MVDDETKKVTSLQMPRRGRYINIAEQLKGDSRKRWIKLFGEEKNEVKK